MSVCPQCGIPAGSNDKFCNGCGHALAGGSGFGASPFGAPPPPYNAPNAGPAYGPPPGAPVAQQQGARCQQGHEIAPGANYCPMGHPIALDAMQFASDMYGAPPPPPPYGAPPPANPFASSPGAPGYGAYAPPPVGGGYGAPQGYGAPSPQPPPAQPNYSAFGAPPPGPPQPQGFGPPPPLDAGVPFVPPGTPGGRMLRAFLLAYQSNPNGDFWPLHGGRLTVGRANAGENLDIPIADATISSRHAALVIDNVSGSVHVEDTGSTNGTYVNDEHLGFNGRRELRDGDRVRFGGFTTMVKVIGRV